MNASRKPLALFLSVVILGSIAVQTAKAQKSSTDDARIARLIGLAKVWGTVKYFHPFLADRDIDWDKALIETIPKVNAAKTPQDYQAALNQMLAVLNDKSTRAEFEHHDRDDHGKDSIRVRGQPVCGSAFFRHHAPLCRQAENAHAP